MSKYPDLPFFNRKQIENMITESYIERPFKGNGLYPSSILRLRVLSDDWMVTDNEIKTIVEIATYESISKATISLSTDSEVPIGTLEWEEKDIAARSRYTRNNGYSELTYKAASLIIDDLLGKAFNKLYYEQKFPKLFSPEELNIRAPGEFAHYAYQLGRMAGCETSVKDIYTYLDTYFTLKNGKVIGMSFEHDGSTQWYKQTLWAFMRKNRNPFLSDFSNVDVEKVVEDHQSKIQEISEMSVVEYFKWLMVVDEFEIIKDSVGKVRRICGKGKHSSRVLNFVNGDVYFMDKSQTVFPYPIEQSKVLTLNVQKLKELANDPNSNFYYPETTYGQ